MFITLFSPNHLTILILTMNKTRRVVAGACIALVTLFSCSGEDNPDPPKPKPPTPPPTEQKNIPINIATLAWTKATDSAFESGDKVGIYVVNYTGTTPGTLATSGNHVNNMGFTYTTSWSPDTQVYWKDQTTKADFYCYYPYTATVSSVSAYPFNVKANQSAVADYKASDLLWGKTADVSPTSSAVQINVKHVMSNLIVKLTPGTGYTANDLKTAVITIQNLKTNSTVNLSTGVATATGSAQNITPKAETDYFRALVPPQSVSNVELIKIQIGDYIYKLTQTITLEANTQHTCTLKVNKTEEGVNIIIGGWDKDSHDYGGTVG